MDRVPQFAVIGHPNEGKSSVVSNLTENDRIAISEVAGETQTTKTYPVKAGGRVVLEFIDTPGFQHPRKILKWFENYARENGGSTGVLEAFLTEKTGDRAFRHDVDLLQPLATGAAAIFVVDASHPIRRHDIAEMEILRQIGCPRMAMLNSKDRSFYLDEWKEELNRHYNIIREFNAHHAPFPERMKLLEALKAMHQEWEKPLAEAIEALRSDWRERLQRSAESICSMLKKAAAHIESRIIDEERAEIDDLKAELKKRYQDKISAYEKRCHREIRKQFRHDKFQAQLESGVVFGNDELFSQETMKVLGLTRRQIVAASAGTLGAIGAAIDLALPGITFGVFAAGGAFLGGLSAFFGAGKLGRVRLGGRFGKKLGGYSLQLGPMKESAPLLYILIDRALLYFNTVSQWSHARREPKIDITEAAAGDNNSLLTRNWSAGERKAVVKFLNKKSGREELRTLRDILVEKMTQ